MRAIILTVSLLLSRELLPAGLFASAAEEVPVELRRWLGPQRWERDVADPVVSLGDAGAFDDTHIFAPAVAIDGGRYLMWYCGSRGFAHDLAPKRTADERVFALGLATSGDGKRFSRHPGDAVLALAENKLSVLTPCVLRNPDGSVLREDGQMRLWFSSATLGGGGQVQSIQETRSPDGVRWSKPSPIQLERAYAPSVVKTPSGYEMWYTEPGKYPWRIRHARSEDGRRWTVRETPVLEKTQEWEHLVLIYPAVTWIDGVYVMWYASYLQANRETTAIGFAVSKDGVTWYKHPDNPVLRPDPQRPWESHYVSSQSAIRLADGSFRMWYASRKAPPFTNLYFALNTARWSGPEAEK